jgi:hypothetical protein
VIELSPSIQKSLDLIPSTTKRVTKAKSRLELPRKF